MQDTVKFIVEHTEGFTLVETKGAKGYIVDLTLEEVSFITVQNMPGVKAALNGTIYRYPQKLLVTQSLTGSGKIGGDTSDGAVKDAVKEGVKTTMNVSVLPTLKKQP
jgi:hypothetical protein